MLGSQLIQGKVTDDLFLVLEGTLKTDGKEWRKLPAIVFPEDVAAEARASLTTIFQKESNPIKK